MTLLLRPIANCFLMFRAIEQLLIYVSSDTLYYIATGYMYRCCAQNIHCNKVKFPGLINYRKCQGNLDTNFLDKNCCNLVLMKCHLTGTFP